MYTRPPEALNINNLYSHSTIIEIRKFTLTESQTSRRFHQFPPNVPFSVPGPNSMLCLRAQPLASPTALFPVSILSMVLNHVALFPCVPSYFYCGLEIIL